MLWGVEAREYLYHLIDMICGARVTTNYTRVGGLRHDLPDDAEEYYRAHEKTIVKLWTDIHTILTNRAYLGQKEINS